jgi:allene oxide cyclase
MVMKKRMTALAVLGAGVVAVAIAASGSAQTSGGRTLHVFERDKGTTFKVLDRGPKIKHDILSVGDELIAMSPVFDQSRKRRIGLISFDCVTTKPGSKKFPEGEQLCSAAYRFKDGQLTTTGSLRDVGEPVEAVTGGTGAYEGAKGTFVSHRAKNEGGSVDTIKLLP